MSRKINNAIGRAKYKRMWAATAGVINQWDPDGLLAGGAPADEYHVEIASLVAQIPRMHMAADASQAVSQVFASNSNAEAFGVEICSELGNKLFSTLSEQGLID